MKNRWVILIILVFIWVTGFLFLKNKSGENLSYKTHPPIRSLVQNNSSYQSITALIVEQTKDKSLEKELLDIEKEPRCWSELDDELQKECPKSECVFDNLKRKQSWASDFFEDGWKDKSQMLQPNQRTALGQSLYALGKAGLLSGREVEENLTEATELLEQLSNDDPKNSFPLVFLAEIYRRQDQKDLSEELLRKAAAPGMQFNSYLKELVKELSLNNVGSPSEILAATGVWSNAPIPNFLAIRKLIDAHPEYAESIASQLVYDGLNAKIFSEMEWVPIEYSVGYALYTKHGGREDVPPFSQLMENRPSLPLHFSSPDCRKQVDDYLSYLRKL
jgi:hypothetical protein